MSHPKHTPGPWVVETNDSWIAVIAVNDDACVAVTADDGQDLGMPTSMANAQLIAAAPDLLAQLELSLELLETLNTQGQLTAWDRITLSQARLAIAKARGES